jgi:predicted N-acetyltransferase YhbS
LREIDRTEVGDRIFHHIDGKLELREEHFDVPYDWWVKHVEGDILPRLNRISDQGGVFYGAFDGPKIVGLVGLEAEFIGKDRDQLNVVILHVGKDHRKRGIGNKLMRIVMERAKEMGAMKLYVSATPSENTVNFYVSLGCVVTKDVDKKLFELEPEDIHMEFSL